MIFCSVSQEVDNSYRNLMRQVLLVPHVLETGGAVGLLESLKNSNEILETINAGVNNYLEKKRLFFPR